MNKLRILVVDDEPDFLEVVGIRIKEWGYEVIETPNSQEAVEHIKNKDVDIVILDYLMPGMDGLSVLTEIRKIDKEIPVIMLTAHPDEKSIKGSEKLGVSAYIPKMSSYSDIHYSLKINIGILEEKLKKKE